QLGDREGGIELLKAALASFEALGSRDECARVLRVLSTAHEAGGDLTQALSCLRKAGALAARRRLDQASVETERFKRLALEDSLTGLANRRSLDDRLASLLREAH